MESKEGTVVRPCGFMEQYSTSRHSLGLYFGVAISGRYVAASLDPSGERPSLDQASFRPVLEEAVAQVILNQPFMRVGIINEDTKPSYVHVPSMDLASHHITWLEPVSEDRVDEALETMLAKQLGTRWPDIDSRPPWKLTVLPSTGDSTEASPRISSLEIVFTYHHALGDGTSGGKFHSNLLKALSSPSPTPSPLQQPNSGSILPLPELPTLPPPQEVLINFQISWPYWFQALWRLIAPSWLRRPPRPNPWRGAPIDFSKPFDTRIRIVNIPSTTATQLLHLARQHSTTLTPLFHALLTASLARRLSQEKAPNFVAGSAISLRRLLNPASTPSTLDLENGMSVLVTATTHPITPQQVSSLRESKSNPTLGDETFWEVTKTVKRSLEEKLASLPRDDVAGLMKYVSSFHSFLKEADGKPYDWTWEVSNLGAIRGTDSSSSSSSSSSPESESWRLERVVFAQSGMMCGPAINLNVVGVKGGAITVALSVQEYVVEEEVLEGVAADLGEWAVRLGEEGKFAF